MARIKDLTGQKFGRLTVIKRVKNDKNGNSQWLCRCECGVEKIVRGAHLTAGKIQSCGCYNRELISKRTKTHGLSCTRLHNTWQKLKDRCYNKNLPCYKNYGARGIQVCPEWKDDFISFYNWAMANGYKDNLTIDRIDVNGNYEPSNCRWVDRKIQARNTRQNKYITYKGETHCIAEWAEIFDIKADLLGERLRQGIDFKTAIKKENLKLLNSHKIRCIDTGEIFENAKSVMKKYNNFHLSALYMNCRKEIKHIKGLHFEYVD